MGVEDMGREGLRLASRFATAAIAFPMAVVFTALGAGVTVGRGLIGLVAVLLPSFESEPPLPRPNVDRIRERASAALQAARASGLVSHRHR
jgi:hypothetical protein